MSAPSAASAAPLSISPLTVANLLSYSAFRSLSALEDSAAGMIR